MDNRMFLLEQGGLVCARKSRTEKVYFESLSEFLFYCPEFSGDLSNKWYIDYEPDRELFIDSEDPSIGMDDAPVLAFEAVIDMVPTLIARKGDPLYGMNATERVEYLRNEKITLIKKVALDRAADYLEAINSFGMVQFLAALWPCLTDPTSVLELQACKEIYVYAKTKIDQAQIATEAQLEAYDPETDPNWP